MLVWGKPQAFPESPGLTHSWLQAIWVWLAYKVTVWCDRLCLSLVSYVERLNMIVLQGNWPESETESLGRDSVHSFLLDQNLLLVFFGDSAPISNPLNHTRNQPV